MTDDDLLAWLGKTKTAARRVVSAYLRSVPEDQRLVDDARLQALGRHHPTRRLPASGAVFVLRRAPPFYTPALYVEARTGGFIDFSWVKCVENLYGAYSRERTRRANTLSALRNEAFRSDAMQSARAQLGDACGRCQARRCKLVVDHADKPFAQIVDEFLAEQGLALADLRVRGSRTDGFRLRRLGRAWRQFHDAQATLVGLCARCNCSLGSRGYRHTKA